MADPAGPSSETVGRLTRRLAAMLRDRGIETPELDARLLVGHVLGLDLTGLVLGADKPVPPLEVTEVMRLGAERLAHKPVGRILGHRGFYGLDFQLSDATLEPRPDTETLVKVALDYLHKARTSHPVIADIGAGSGAILIALLANVPSVRGMAIDISEEALHTTRENALRNGVSERVMPVRASYAEILAPAAFDLVVSNPPYIASGEIGRLAPDVRDHDPMLALDGGADGLDAYRAIVPRAFEALKPNGALIVEIGHDQAETVMGLFEASRFAEVSLAVDLAGRPRVVTGRRP